MDYRGGVARGYSDQTRLQAVGSDGTVVCVYLDDYVLRCNVALKPVLGQHLLKYFLL